VTLLRVGILAAAATAVGCSSAPQELSTESGATVLIAASSDGGMDAIASGTIAMVGPCLGARTGGGLRVVVWPSDTSTTGDTVEAGGRRVALGETFAGAGGYLTPPYPDAFPEIPEECLDAASSDEVIWVQSLGDVTSTNR
jgi:hypothetical protein